MIRRVGGYLAYREDAPNEASAHLQAYGYVTAPAVFTSEEIDELRSEIDAVYEQMPPDGRGPYTDAWPEFRYQMLNRSAACQRAIAHRGILDVIEPLLGEDCHVIANTAWRNPITNGEPHGGVGWHIDAGPHIPLSPEMTWPEDIPHPVFAIGTHIYLEDCDLVDGPTSVIPGSHLSGRTPPPKQLMDDDLEYNGQRETPMIAKAGDVGFFVSDIWHRRMPAQAGDRGRFFLQAHYGRRDIAQRLIIPEECHQLSPEAIARLETERDRTVAGLHPRLFYDG